MVKHYRLVTIYLLNFCIVSALGPKADSRYSNGDKLKQRQETTSKVDVLTSREICPAEILTMLKNSKKKIRNRMPLQLSCCLQNIASRFFFKSGDEINYFKAWETSRWKYNSPFNPQLADSFPEGYGDVSL